MGQDWGSPFTQRARLGRGEGLRNYTLELREEARERAEAEAAAPPSGPPVYFVRCECPMKFIKIGTAVNVATRLAVMRTSSPYELTLIGALPTGGYKVELQWHREFKHLRARGEWFYPGDNLVAAIRAALTDKET